MTATAPTNGTHTRERRVSSSVDGCQLMVAGVINFPPLFFVSCIGSFVFKRVNFIERNRTLRA